MLYTELQIFVYDHDRLTVRKWRRATTNLERRFFSKLILERWKILGSREIIDTVIDIC